jgi:hypothetical protein
MGYSICFDRKPINKLDEDLLVNCVHNDYYDKFCEMWKCVQKIDRNWINLFKTNVYIRRMPNETIFDDVVNTVIYNLDKLPPVEIINQQKYDFMYRFDGINYAFNRQGLREGSMYLMDINIKTALVYLDREHLFDVLFPISIIREWKLKQLL